MTEYLYHYTSLDTLQLILKSKKIRFNNLDNMDDANESITLDLKNLRKHVYTSSWTKESKESIPLWKFYSDDMKGVRIKLPENPFKIVHVKEEVEGLKIDDLVTPELLENIKKQLALYSPGHPVLMPITYTEDEDLLAQNVMNIDRQNDHIMIKYENIGRFKDKDWEFQREWRYKINSYPISHEKIGSAIRNSNIKIVDFILRSYEESQPLPFIDIEIDEEAFRLMEVTGGPKMNDAQKSILEKSIQQYNANMKFEYSKLNIR